MSAIALPKTTEGLKNLGRLQDIPMVRQLLTLGVTAAAIALGLWLFFWTQKPTYAPLPGLDVKTAGEARDVLRTAQVPFKIDPTTGALSVPEDRIGEARMALAAGGIGAGEDRGFAAMEGDQGFGTSQFVENARYQHALETELARTISNLRPVREARVHLAMPKPSAFTRNKDPASASVVLQLQSGASLEQGQVDAIVHLVSSSIPGLPASNVTVVDQFGRLLSNPDPDSDAAISAKQFERQRRQEAVFVRRIQELLEPMTGPGRVRAEVSVDMDFSQTEQASEKYGPDPAIVRSEQLSESGNLAAANPPQGVPGSASNTPAATAAANPDPNAAGAAGTANAAQATAATGNGSRSSVRNYEIDRTLTHTRQAPGRISRVTAAVLVDNLAGAPGKNGKPTERALNAQEVQRIQSLVQQAIGFDAQRGDVVTVVNSPFARQPEVATEPAPFWENPRARDLLRTLLGGLAVLAVVWFVLRPAFRALTTPKVLVKHEPQQAEVTEMLDHDDQPVTPALTQERVAKRRDFEAKVQVARDAVTTDSKRVASVVRDLVNADE
ncbi:flagellar basal-body MS-ring/collar protein FliF [Thermomonas sp. XSG]|uniref:flagellar basal-body MS-ring/collar protein FliF n=1 Tax=Thermomonas sp. XSG TaxID=2771436 RepID=UPI001680036A|nr:flagellar basal-body MS-ring/collar protein FliF [Thermomonas sp. XSG]QNU16350.1 flagellar M-ring protein FliF [Thermomonas sp. XSG]